MRANASPLMVSRAQIVSFRLASSCLDGRLPFAAGSLQKAAWAGLQDSMPRSALLSLHARVQDVHPDDWRHDSLIQLWGPRFNVYVVTAKDHAVFSLGRLPIDANGLKRAKSTAERLRIFLGDRQMPFGQVGHQMNVMPNSLRYAAPTGTVMLHWDGARQPLIRIVSAPAIEPLQARVELARRFLRIFGPATLSSFVRWAGIRESTARGVFKQLASELIAVRTPIGDSWILARDEAALREGPQSIASPRFLPSGDAFYLAWGNDRDLLVADPKRQTELWTARVWPGALLLRGEIAGIWSRKNSDVSIRTWRRLSSTEANDVEAEVMSLPLRSQKRSITLRWARP